MLDTTCAGEVIRSFFDIVGHLQLHVGTDRASLSERFAPHTARRLLHGHATWR